MNVMVPFTALAGILTYAWPFAQTESSFIVVIVIYGSVFFFLSASRLVQTHPDEITVQVQLRNICFVAL